MIRSKNIRKKKKTQEVSNQSYYGQYLQPKIFDIKVCVSNQQSNDGNKTPQGKEIQSISFILPQTFKQKYSGDSISLSGIHQSKREENRHQRYETNENYQYISQLYSNKEIKDAFKLLDKDDNDKVFPQDLVQFMQEYGQPLDQNDDMIKLSDFKGRGYITYQEFQRIAKRMPLNSYEDSFYPNEKLLRTKKILQKIEKNQQIYKQVFSSNQSTHFLVQLLRKNNLLKQ